MQITIEYAGKVYAGYTAEEAIEAGIPQPIVDKALFDATHELATVNRRNAYAIESDPLYMEWQYDNTAEKEQVWRDKVAEIKARYPLPVESA
ncbi:hypothetical protein P3746_20610 [Vibrio parahaemolyticus]|nr:hypothetical protein [Vibrio parahaemolyticus]